MRFYFSNNAFKGKDKLNISLNYMPLRLGITLNCMQYIFCTLDKFNIRN